jgi:arylsulfatase A-like enzyme
MPASETQAADRVVVALAGSALAGLVVGAVDAGWASGGAPSLRLALTGIGLLAPLTLVMGCTAAAARVLLLPPSFPRLGDLVARVRALPEDERRALAVRAVVAPLAALVAVVFAARVALRSLASVESAATSGAALGLATAGLGALAVLATVALRASPPLHRVSPNPIALGGAAVALAVAAFLVLVALGTTSGAGGLIALFGVFKRQELDLRGVSLLLVLLLGGLLLPAMPKRVPRWAFALVAVLPLGLVPCAALSGLDEKSALAVERKAPLGKRVLPALRRASDRDRDGASAWFAGGDCAEGNAKVGPAADDIPGNGIDEDCSGSDAAPVLAKPSAPPRSAAALAEIKQRIPEKPNVVLITIDALRAELGYMGYPRPISPSIDELAKKSTVFENAYSLASYTSKSLGPMLIGRYGMETHRGYLHFNRFTRADTFLSERLKGAGIRTVSVQGHWYFFKNYGFERGYDVLDTEATPADQPIEGDRSTNGDKLSDRIIHQLSRPELAEKQFFLWSHYIDPHAEYVPHDGFDFGTKGRDRYDGEIAFVDHHFGRVLKALAASPFAARTVVIVTSDHGEAFGEHDLYRHGFELWEELVRVPLVIYVPGLEGRRIKVRRSAIDIVPTVLEIFGIERPKPDARDALRGESLLPDLIGPSESITERPIFIDMPGGPYNDERQAYIENGLKLVTSMGRTLSLFDLVSDPGERRDLSDDKARLRPILDKTKAFRRSLDEVVERPK